MRALLTLPHLTAQPLSGSHSSKGRHRSLHRVRRCRHDFGAAAGVGRGRLLAHSDGHSADRCRGAQGCGGMRSCHQHSWRHLNAGVYTQAAACVCLTLHHDLPLLIGRFLI